MKNESYIFQSQRLGFRAWKESDLEEFKKMNADPEVMRHFPKTLSEEQSAGFFQRLQDHYEKHGFCYFATDILETGELIGFIGFAYQDYESEFTPAIDIGWRLKQSAWGNGYATEGAKRCLEFGFETLGLSSVISTCTFKNTPSEKVMKKIGMIRQGTFNHPRLSEYPDLEKCVCYTIEK